MKNTSVRFGKNWLRIQEFPEGFKKEGIPHEQITHDRLWNKRPDGIAFKISTKTKAGVICLLEVKVMSDVTNQYIVRTKHVAEVQYTSLRSALTKSM